MSGIEVAGLVLGAFPILIRALESYREGAEFLGDWWRIQRAYTKCRQDLQYHQVLFEGNVERFLLPLVVDDEELKNLMSDPAGEAWRDEELEARLKERLPKSYRIFLDTMGNINDLMEDLKKELGVYNRLFGESARPAQGSSGTDVKRNDLLSISNFEFQTKRIKFSLKRSSRERLFVQFQHANDRMRSLLENSDQIAIARRDREPGKNASVMGRKLNDFWRHAKRLHDALSSAWQCSCVDHQTTLQLQHRTSDKPEFDVVFNLGSRSGHGCWKPTRITALQEVQSDPCVDVAVSVTQHLGSLRNQRQVQWSISRKRDVTSQSDSDDLVRIHDLCSTLSRHSPDCFGFLDSGQHRFMVYAAHGSLQDNLAPVTLETLLNKSGSLTRRKRYYLALVLASSYLQLGSTPWLRSRLRRDNILFLHDPTDMESIPIERPYIRRELSETSNVPASEVMSSLGIRLLELCFGMPLEQSRFRKQFPEGDTETSPFLDYAAALQWSKTASEEAGPDFAEAISWCLNAKDAQEGAWRKELWTHVIVPLDSCHRQVSSKPVLG